MIEHLPPEFLSQLQIMHKFRNTKNRYQSHCKKLNVKFLQASSTVDVFGLGVILLQIATGCPAQLDLPLKVNLRTVANRCIMATTLFGHCLDGAINDKHAGQTIKLQERLLGNTHLYLRNKQLNQYSLLSDYEFVTILTKMVHANYFQRADVAEVMNSIFIRRHTGKMQKPKLPDFLLKKQKKEKKGKQDNNNIS